MFLNPIVGRMGSSAAALLFLIAAVASFVSSVEDIEVPPALRLLKYQPGRFLGEFLS